MPANFGRDNLFPMAGYVYILTSEALSEDVYKIGYTNRNPGERVKEIGRGAGALPGFEVVWHLNTNHRCRDVERKVHRRLSDSRLSKRKEFFEVDLERAKRVIREADGRPPIPGESNRPTPKSPEQPRAGGDWQIPDTQSPPPTHSIHDSSESHEESDQSLLKTTLVWVTSFFGLFIFTAVVLTILDTMRTNLNDSPRPPSTSRPNVVATDHSRDSPTPNIAAADADNARPSAATTDNTPEGETQAKQGPSSVETTDRSGNNIAIPSDAGVKHDVEMDHRPGDTRQSDIPSVDGAADDQPPDAGTVEPRFIGTRGGAKHQLVGTSWRLRVDDYSGSGPYCEPDGVDASIEDSDIESCPIEETANQSLTADLRIGSNGEVHTATIQIGFEDAPEARRCIQDALLDNRYPAQGDGRCFYRFHARVSSE